MVAQIPLRPGSVQTLQGTNPRRYIEEGRNLQFAANQVAGLSRAVMRESIIRETDNASTNMSLEFSEFMQGLGEQEFITADDAREMGIESDALFDDEGQDRQEIPVWEIAPDAVKQKYDQLTEKFAAKITGAGNREEWSNRRRLQGERLYSELLESSRESARAQAIRDHEFAITRAVQLGDPALALELAANHPNPQVREETVFKTQQGLENNAIQNAYQSQDPEQMIEMADYLRSDDYSGSLTEQQRTNGFNMLRAEASRLSQVQEAKRIMPAQRLMEGFEISMAAGNVAGAAKALNDLEAYLIENDRYDYVGKDYFPSRKARITAAITEQEEELNPQIEYFMRGDHQLFQATNSKATTAVNNFINDIMEDVTLGLRSGEYSVEQVQEMVQDITTASAKSNFIPTAIKEMFVDSNRVAANPQEVMAAAGIYNQLKVQNPILVKQVDDNTRYIMEEVYNAATGGISSPDVIKEIKERYARADERTLERREQLYKQLPLEGPNSPQEFMRDRLNGSAWIPNVFESIWNPAVDAIKPEVMSQAADEMDRLVRHHMMNGADAGTAKQMAYEDWLSNNQLTKVNGDWEFMKHSPEVMYGVSGEQVRSDLSGYLNTISSGEITSAEGYYLQPDLVTDRDDEPTYALYHEREDGLMEMVIDQEGRPIRYKPDVMGIKVEAKKQELAKAKRMRLPNNGNSVRDIRERIKMKRIQSAAERSDPAIDFVEDRAREMGSDRAIMTEMLNETN